MSNIEPKPIPLQVLDFRGEVWIAFAAMRPFSGTMPLVRQT